MEVIEVKEEGSDRLQARTTSAKAEKQGRYVISLQKKAEKPLSVPESFNSVARLGRKGAA